MDWFGASEVLIAIVDDDPLVRAALARVVRAGGYAVDLFASGVEFLEALAQRVPRCVVLDRSMPRLDGFEVQLELARRGWCIPVILVSADCDERMRRRAEALGAIACMPKPVDDSALIEVIAAAVAPG